MNRTIHWHEMEQPIEALHLASRCMVASYFEGESPRSMLAVRPLGAANYSILGRALDKNIYYFRGCTSHTCQYLYSIVQHLDDDDCQVSQLVRFDLSSQDFKEDIILEHIPSLVHSGRFLPGDLLDAQHDTHLILKGVFEPEYGGVWVVRLSLNDLTLERLCLDI